MKDWLIMAAIVSGGLAAGALGYLWGLAAGYRQGYREACRNIRGMAGERER